MVRGGSRVCILYLGVLRRRYMGIVLSVCTSRNAALTKEVNRIGSSMFPSITWSCIAVVRGANGLHTMEPHDHVNDDSALSSEFTIGDYWGGEFFTCGLVSSGSNRAPASIAGPRGPVQGVSVDARHGVVFNSHLCHCPLPWVGEPVAMVFFGSVAWRGLNSQLSAQVKALHFPY